MSRAVARIGVLIAFLIGLDQFAQAAGPAANQEMGGAKESNQSNPVALQQTEGLDPTLAMDARSGTLYVAWARCASGTGTAPLEVVVARSEDGGRSFTHPIAASGGDSDIATAAVDPPQIAVGPKGEVYVLYHRQVTGTAEHRSISLPDGSTAELTAQTALAVHYEGHERRVELLHGEAVFRVRPDPAHPFIVTSARGSARALGTEFLVARHGGGTTVAVLEGQVEIAAEQKTLQLTGGHAARYGEGQAPARLPDATLPELTAWREGYLRFSRTPLGEVIEELNRYHPAKIVLMNRALAERPVSGQFPLHETERIIDTVIETAALERVDVTPYVVLLY